MIKGASEKTTSPSWESQPEGLALLATLAIEAADATPECRNVAEAIRAGSLMVLTMRSWLW